MKDLLSSSNNYSTDDADRPIISKDDEAAYRSQMEIT